MDVTAPGHVIGKCLRGQFGEGLCGERLARHVRQLISPFSVRSEDELLHRLDTVRGKHRAFGRRKYALGTACTASPAQVEAVTAVPVASLRVYELHRLRSVTDRLRKMAEATLTTLAFSVSI
ncbi:hypothetical protein OHT20_19030 [Streptomyces caniferus]|uniref:hypothetical protein n=1 Tax=Streptomyces caniferus TaxID=285557 RepID=UPI002E2E6C16|nr:hypothetical protein [Streptomyces caniferus]